MRNAKVLFAAMAVMVLAACETRLDGPANNGGQQDAGPQTDAAGTDTGHTCPAGYHWDDAIIACVQNSGTDAGTTDTGHNCPSGYHWDSQYNACVQDSTDGGNVSGNVRITAGTSGNISVDSIILNGEFTLGTSTDDFGGWAELNRASNASRIESSDQVDELGCVRYNTVTRDNGAENYLCFGYGSAAAFTATTSVTVNGASWTPHVVSVIWREGNNTLYGCSAVACRPGLTPPTYLDLR